MTARKTSKTTTQPRQTAARYADAETATRLAEGLRAARAAGFTRPALRELTGLTAAQLWRGEQGRAHAAEVRSLDDALARIASGDVKPPERATATRSSARVAPAAHALETALGEKTLTGTRKLIREALDLLQPGGKDDGGNE